MRDITQLHPTLQAKLARLKALCKAQGMAIGISECVRSVAEQDALYAKGRTAPGEVVTNARGSTYGSMHQWGVAFDFYRADGKGAYCDTDGFFTKVGKIGQSIGLEWGGAWKTICDTPHFQLPTWGSGPSKLKKAYGAPDKFRAAWPKVTTVAAAAAKEGETVTQEQFNAMLNNALVSLAKQEPGAWSEEARAWAEANGLITGDQTGNKQYKAYVTREALAQVLYRQNKNK